LIPFGLAPFAVCRSLCSYPYSKLKAMNVGGTVECLRMATAGAELASCHFVSSTSVFDSPFYMEQSYQDGVPEDDDLEGASPE
jgi:L-aminoadipate-semialdehyde dehydrogenase